MPRPYYEPEDRADAFRALANRHRRRMIDHLRSGPKSFDQLHQLVPVTQAGLSNHLSILHECGLVERRLNAGKPVYHLRASALNRVARWASNRSRKK